MSERSKSIASAATCAARVAGWLGALLVALGCSKQPHMVGSVDTAGTGGSAGSAAGAAGAPAGRAGTSGGGNAGSSGATGSSAGGADAAGAAPAQGGAGGASGAAGSNTTPDPMGAGMGGSPASNGTGPGDWGPGDYPPDLMSANWLEISGVAGQGEYVRQYKVHVPPSYQPDVPMPLVFCIHGLGQDALLFCVTGAAMPPKSDAAGFILVMPNGYSNSWNAGTCCGAASSEQLDDVALFRAIFAEVGEHLNVDLDRVYATGLSNGGYMSYRLACEAADIITAVAPGAGAIGINDIGGGTNGASDFTTCTPSRPISVLHTHGTMDPLIPFSLQAPTMSLMAMNDQCGTTTKPATIPLSGGDTTCVTHEGCPAGIELTACTVEGGGHCWFGSEDCGTGGGAIGLAIVGANSDTMKNTDSAWAFFERLSR